MKNGNIILPVFLIFLCVISSAFAADSLRTRTIQNDTTRLVKPDQTIFQDSLYSKMPKMLPYQFQMPGKYPDSRMSLGPAENYMDPKISIAPADNSMDPKICIPLRNAPVPYYHKFNEKRDFRFPERPGKRK